MVPILNSLQSKLSWKAASLFVLLDPNWHRKFKIGGRVVLTPLVGWPIAMGYRKVLIEHLRDGRTILPDWEDWPRYLKDGFRSVAIIFAYYSPLYLALGFLLVERGGSGIPWLGVALFFTAFTLFLPLAFPVILFSNFVFGSTPLLIQPVEAIAMTLAFWLLTFFIPAGFLQVSETGKYLSAFNLFKVCFFVQRNLRGYLEAWLYSGWISLIGHLYIFRHPWMIFWSYQSILYSFNEILFVDDRTKDGLENSLFNKLRAEEWDGVSLSSKQFGVAIPKMES